jgi:signal transduction histidine kinase
MSRQNRGQVPTRISRQVWLMLVSQTIWLSLLIGFFAWWGHLLRRQEQRIAELETAAGVANETVVEHLDKMNRIIFWEAGSMVLLVVVISLCILWLFLRDARRTRSVQAFFAGVTHELRTPMTGIRLQAESIVEKTKSTDSIYKLANRLLEDTGKLESHLEQTLELARVEGGDPPQLEVIDLEASLERYLRDWRFTHGADNLTVKYEFDGNQCMADPVALQTILRNLFDNTFRHSGNPQANVFLRATAYGQKVVVSYQDDGEGFNEDPDVLGKVFVKGGSSDGSGVGLYLVSALMEQMGGRATFRSHNGFLADLEFPAATRQKEVSGEH